MAYTTESVVVRDSREAINFDLSGYSVAVVGYRMTEDGYELVVEGEASEIDELVLYWQDGGVLSGT